MTNKPMLSVPRELIEQAMLACFEAGFGITHDKLRALLDKPAECRCKRYGKDNPHWPCPVHAKPAAQRQGAPAVLMELVENKIYGGMHIAKWDNPGGLKEGFHKLYAEQPAPVADQAQCEECKGWGYHENHYEGGGTECGECGGSGNATVAVAVVMPERETYTKYLVGVIPHNANEVNAYKDGWNTCLEEVARLNGVKT